MTVDYTKLLLWMLPELVVLAGALAVLFVDLGWMRQRSIAERSRVGVFTGCFFIVAAIFCVASNTEEVREFRSMLVLNSFGAILKTALLALSALTMLLFIE